MLFITATTRLARELRRLYDNEQIADGRATWLSPDVLPVNAWLTQLWQEWLYSDRASKPVQLLRESQERTIWEDIVRGPAGNSELLQVGATTDAAMGAWNLACGWRLPADRPEWNDTSDSEVFRIWADEFGRRCDENNWLSSGHLAEFISDRLEDGSISVPGRIVFAGFTGLTPAQKHLLKTLRRNGIQVEEQDDRDAAGDSHPVRIGLIDPEAEVRAAAQWTRQRVKDPSRAGGPDERIGIVVPDLAAYRSQLERVFSQEFHPNALLSPGSDAERIFNISLGPTLPDYPLVDAAFLILRAHPFGMAPEDAGRLVRSPFISGASEEYTSRALLDAAMRRRREAEISISLIIRMAQEGTEPHSCPELARSLSRWKKEWEALPTEQMPSEWAASLSRLLEAIGWPGERPLNSPEYQTAGAWRDLVSELATLDGVVAGSLTLSGAVTSLGRLAAGRHFQPESEPAPIQILGIFEAAGLRFDHLWVMGMHDGVWPRSSGPNPFLPLRLQREMNLPGSSPGRELAFAKLLTDRLLSGAPSVVVSYPEREADSDLRPSPLFVRLGEVTAEDLGITGTIDYVEQLRLSSAMETIDDHDAPPWDGPLAHGGTAIFADQAACPFRAFAKLRLGADAIGDAVVEPGLSALDRGLLIHGVLERVWNQLQSHEVLLSTSTDQLRSVVRLGVEALIRQMSARKSALTKTRFAAIEQIRLTRLVTDWLELEKARLPFTVVEQEEKHHVRVGGIDLAVRSDRVDRLEDGTRVVIDYKSSDRHRPSEWDGDRPDAPQLPLYATTLDEEWSGVFFGILKTGKIGFRGTASSEGIVPFVKPKPKDVPLDEAIENWRVVLDRLGEEFRQGKAVVDPKKPGQTCQYCGLGALCRINEAVYIGDEGESGGHGA